MVEGLARYRAFISYSHSDRSCADWLHRALEAYRLPARLVGTETLLGPVPARLAPVFRDRDELPASGDLSAELRAALDRSAALVLIASPAAARSRWVNEEVLQFKAMRGREGRPAPVLALIAADAPPDAALSDMVPPAMRHAVHPDGTLGPETAEPIAADLRPGADGRRLARLKLVAGLTGLPLDALVQREAARRQRRLALLASVLGVLAAAMTVMAVLAVRGQSEAERQRAEADGLVRFMLTDLRARLEPVGRLDVLDSVGQRALAYYAGQDLSRLDPDELGRRAKALHLVGEVRDLRGDSAGALVAFREAERTTQELLARAPDDPQRLYDHAQSAYWVGYVAWQRGDRAEAERRFRQYAMLADTLVAADPANPEWQAERASAQTNLGVLYHRSDRFDDAAARFAVAASVARMLAQAAPADGERQWTLAQAHAWLADAQAGRWRFSEAVAQRQAELAIYDRMLATDPRDARAREGRAVALQQMAGLRLLQGDQDAAVELARAGVDATRDLRRSDEANRLWHELAVLAANQHVEALMAAGRWTEAATANAEAVGEAERLVAIDPTVDAWRTQGLMGARWMEVAISHARGRHDEARSLSAGFARRFADDRDSGPGPFALAHDPDDGRARCACHRRRCRARCPPVGDRRAAAQGAARARTGRHPDAGRKRPAGSAPTRTRRSGPAALPGGRDTLVSTGDMTCHRTEHSQSPSPSPASRRPMAASAARRPTPSSRRCHPAPI